MNARVWELPPGSEHRIGFVGVSLCVSDDFVRDMKTPPQFWFGPELIKRISHGNSPVLSDQQVKEANSRGGLNMVAWEGCFRPELETYEDANREMIKAFIDAHRGYFWKEIIAAQLESAARLHWILQTGGFLWDPREGGYTTSVEHVEKLASEPHVMGVTRELEYQGRGSWVGELFRYAPPRLGFSPSEQQLLMHALNRLTDAELASRLHVSIPTVKKTWRSIYTRIDARLPELFPESSRTETESQRGKEKRRRAVAYIGEHPEELRPVCRKLLERSAVS